MALGVTTIATAIASLSISGVAVKDLNAIPQQVAARDCPILYPSPDNFIGAGTTAIQTFGTVNQRYWEVNRSLTYVYLHALAGTERTLASYWQSMAGKVDAVWTAFIGLNVSGVDVTDISTTAFGVLQDAAGNQFYGCLFSLGLKEKVNP